MSAARTPAASPFLHLVEHGYASPDLEEGEEPIPEAFAALVNRVFERLVGQASDPLWLGIVETLEPGSSAWMDAAFGASVVSLEERASWWPGTERLSLGDTRVRAVPVESFGRDWRNLGAAMDEGFYAAFDPFLFSRHPEGDLCVLQTVGHEGMASCLLAEGALDASRWLESMGFSRADDPWQPPSGAGEHRLCGARTRADLVEIFGEESVVWIERKAR